MELKWLEDFLCITNTGSFSKAAESRNVTQSAFSRRIMALEQWLGATLIDRTSHPITLTDEGIRFIETAQQSVRMFHKVRNDFNNENRKKRRSLSIGIADHLAIHFFPSWIHCLGNDLSLYYFELQSSIRSGTGFFEALRFQEYDLLICYRQALEKTTRDANNFTSLTLGNEALIPVCAKQKLKEQQYQLPGTAEQPLPFISYKPYSSLLKAVSELTTTSAVAPIHLETVIETSSAESMKSLAINGFGIAWLPESAVTKELDNGVLQHIGDSQYHIPLAIEIHRHLPNTKPEIMAFWERLASLQIKEQ